MFEQGVSGFFYLAQSSYVARGCWLDENYQEDGKVWNKISGSAGAGIDVVAGDGEDKDPSVESIA